MTFGCCFISWAYTRQKNYRELNLIERLTIKISALHNKIPGLSSDFKDREFVTSMHTENRSGRLVQYPRPPVVASRLHEPFLTENNWGVAFICARHNAFPVIPLSYSERVCIHVDTFLIHMIRLPAFPCRKLTR